MLVDTPGTEHWVGAGKAAGRHGLRAAASSAPTSTRSTTPRRAAAACSTRSPVTPTPSPSAATRSSPRWPSPPSRTSATSATMTYLQWLQRYVELAIGDGRHSTADTADAGHARGWTITWRDRFEQMLQRAEARLHAVRLRPDRDTVRRRPSCSSDPEAAIAALRAALPGRRRRCSCTRPTCRSSSRCARRSGKPVNFVPVIDKDVRRWWRSDSLWQAHDARYAADQVCIIPGTAAVAGITRVDEPVGELLDRFEQAAVDEVLAAGGDAGAGRRPAARAAPTSRGPLAVVLDAPDVLWAGRTATNPVHRIAEPTRLAGARQPDRSPPPTRPPVRACTVADDEHVVLSVPLSGTWIDIRFTLTDVVRRRRRAGGVHRGRRRPRCARCSPSPPASTAPMRCRRCTTARRRSPSPGTPSRSPTTPVSPRRSARRWRPTLTVVPDALVGRCWPAVFAAIGAAATDAGVPGRRGPAEPGAPGPRRPARGAAAHRGRPN